jgi:hypothetical protein
MASKKSPRKFRDLDYRSLQQTNSQNRAKLSKEDQKWLKYQDYKNVGWDNAIALYKKLEELLDRTDDSSLENLFLEADRIGSKYQTPEEIAAFNQQLAKEVNEISDLIDQQFPDTEIEVIDYSTKSQRNQKTYRATKRR